MASLSDSVRGLRKTRVAGAVSERMREFECVGRKPSDKLFSELCFCILTANYSAERAIRIQEEVGGGFLTLGGGRLAAKLKELGHRFPNSRAAYIVGARKHEPELKRILGSLEGNQLRDWFAGNIRGLGLKEASHFLRNIGFTDYAIIDFHILDVLAGHGLIEKPKTLSKKKYLEIEGLLRAIAVELGLSLGELDLYLWYTQTGKILK